MESKRHKVRMLPKNIHPQLKDVFRIYLPFETLKALGLRSGDLCSINRDTAYERTAIVWPGSREVSGGIVQTSDALREAFSLNLGDEISISKDTSPLSSADIVYLRNVTEDKDLSISLSDDKGSQSTWQWQIQQYCGKTEILAPGMVFKNVELKGERRSFVIDHIEQSNGVEVTLARFSPSSKVRLIASDESDGRPAKRDLKLDPTAIGGLAAQLNQLNDILALYTHKELSIPWLTRPCGLLLYGPSGTGKTMLLGKLAGLAWNKVLTIDTSLLNNNSGETSSALSRIFTAAKGSQRSMIVIDNLDTLAAKRGSYNEISIAATLGAEMDALNNESAGSQVLVVGATSRINTIDESLRRPDRFEFEIEIPVPDVNSRYDILQLLTKTEKDSSLEQLRALAERTHGYTRADLRALLRRAGLRSHLRRLNLDDDTKQDSTTENENSTPNPPPELEDTDVEAALEQIQPTAMREIFLEVPKVRWSDIGGQDEVKRSLKEVVEWPYKNPQRMKRLGIEPAKGLLLYGPPGCSKTMTAKALATETGLNFLAVKGPEIFSMYVGETERRLREIFQKARTASPSIIFFDEIEAIASSRDAGQNAGIHTLTTLLNELDGIETLKSVMILAATNKPDLIDLALLRPGRIDTLLYVGPPDHQARVQILQGKLAKMDVVPDLDLQQLATSLDGYSGAEIISVCEKAGSRAFHDSEVNGTEERIGQSQFAFAIDKVKPQISEAENLKFKQWSVIGVKKI